MLQPDLRDVVDDCYARILVKRAAHGSAVVVQLLCDTIHREIWIGEIRVDDLLCLPYHGWNRRAADAVCDVVQTLDREQTSATRAVDGEVAQGLHHLVNQLDRR